MNQIQRTIVEAAGTGELRVEIAIGDTLDTPGAREGIRFAVVLASPDRDRPLSAIQILALAHIRDALNECIDALRPPQSA
jgi:hypothetical protein